MDLPDTLSSLVDTDGSEALTLAISTIPEGTTISDGVNSFTATSSNSEVDITGWNVNNMTVTAPIGSSSYDLIVTATSTEASNGSTSSTSNVITISHTDDITTNVTYGTQNDDFLNGTSQDDFIDGLQGNDIIYGGDGDDIIYGGDGNDIIYGQDGNDVFVFQSGQGTDTIDGGAGGWTDSIQLDGFYGQTAEQGWTLQLDNGDSISSINNIDGEMFLSDDSSGMIIFDDGSTITFDNIDKITW
jgi:Ca2+-binding RTX toxin-like protein